MPLIDNPVQLNVSPLPSSATFENAADVAFVPTGTIAATNVQDAIAELDSDKLSAGTAAATYAPLASPNFTGDISVGGVAQKKTYALTVADDAVGIVSLSGRPNGGLAELMHFSDIGYNFPSPGFSSMFYYDTGGSIGVGKTNITYIGGIVDVVATNVTGTSGTDGRVTVAVQSNQIKIENRSGTIAYFLVTV
jgi:hypothetical protein